ncbi:CYTH domain-containing protein [Shouchella shacheensis]|uniref:CYTH domain-containing protein n=1 Tax=Shouchella shacheensis TaxID=1649580 RepID=UPI0007403620|nr:CYTH domain-containing protein [Shouchella shacheensis]
MATEMEYEAKSLVTEAQFKKLLTHFQFSSENGSKQRNNYYDTNDFLLKESRAALRTRVKAGKCVLTLKQPSGDGLLETHQALTKTEEKALEGGVLPEGEVKEAVLLLLPSLSDLHRFGTLTTIRYQKATRNGFICLDQSTYLDTVDFELEVESSTVHEATAMLRSILTTIGTRPVETKSKIARLYHRARAETLE